MSQRGVAYDAASDTFYVGGWNDMVIYHVAGPSWDTPGETLSSCAPADGAIAGLAWNPAFSVLWMSTNSEADLIYVVDPATCEILNALPHPEPGFNGAGIELDNAGNLWTVSQNSATAYLIESGLPVFSNAPWLSVTPQSGTVPIDGTTDVSVRVSSFGRDPGVYRAQVVFLTNDPDASAVPVPVTLVVPAYQRGINAGGPGYAATNGIRFQSDREYTEGGFGYFGPSGVRSTTLGIAGTSDDTLYQRMRVGMRQYRFDVPTDGMYTVQLRFAEIEYDTRGQRVFTVFVEREPVLVNLDVFREVGARRALNFTFVTPVTDGTLNVRFSGQLGDRPMVSALVATHRPDLAE